MNTTHNLITLGVNLLLALSFFIVYSRIVRRRISPDTNETDSPFLALILLAGVGSFGVLSYSCTSAFQTMLDIEMAREVQFARLSEFLGLYAAILVAATLLVLLLSYLVWKVTISDGKSLKLAMDDRQVSSALIILVVSLVLALMITTPVQSLVEGFIRYPTSPVFR